MISYSWFISLMGIYVSYLFVSNSYESFILLFSQKILSLLQFPIDQMELMIEIEKFPSKLMIVTSHTSVYDFIIGFKNLIAYALMILKIIAQFLHI
jgi:hypothetical protein